ncbi:MAG: DUF2793 domain-containing protein [Xanthobacteraceae bacterium]
MTDTVHLGLPVIEAAQAQKHVTHNEALAVLDALVMLAVIDRDLDSPPAEPAEGDRYIVNAPGAGSFAGKDDQIAHYLDGSWSFYPPAPGWTCYVEDEAILVAWDGAAWQAVSGGGGGGGPITELQDLDRLGVGTTADATNPFAARLNNALWTAKPVVDGGDGSLRYKLSKESADKTLSFLFQDDFSGRAEIGLTGDDDFHFKVSADGSAWSDALIIDKASGAAKLAASVRFTGVVSPAQITSDQDDFDPAGLAGASVLRLSSDASRALTGLAGGADGRIVFVHNSGAQAIVLKDEDASSAAANRFALRADLTLAPDAVALLQYDGTASRWRAIAGGEEGGGATGALRYDTAQSLSAAEKDQALANVGMPPSSLPFLFRNRLINGDFRIDQRNAGAAQTITAGAAKAYTVDRFYAYCTGANVTGQRIAGSGQNQYLYQFTGAPGVSKLGFAQRISAANILDLNGGMVTFSVLLANSLLTTVTWTAWHANSTDAFGALASPTRTQIASGSFTVDGTLQRYAAQIALPAGAANGVEIEVSVGAQTGGTWTIGKLQLEVGAVANPVFQPRPVELEKMICQDYARVIDSAAGLAGAAPTTSRAFIRFNFENPMRGVPTMSFIGSGNFSITDDIAFNFDAASPTDGSSTSLSRNGGRVDVSGFSGLTVGKIYFGKAGTGTRAILFDAEL